eukprot:3773189-Rhodomonas_salina.1
MEGEREGVSQSRGCTRSARPERSGSTIPDVSTCYCMHLYLPLHAPTRGFGTKLHVAAYS